MDNNDPNNPNQNFAANTPPQPTQPTPNPWATPASPPPAPDFLTNTTQEPVGALPPTAPVTEPSWPSSTNTTDPSINSQIPQPSVQQNPTDFSQPPASIDTNPVTSNPFLQPQSPQQSIPPTDPISFSESSTTPMADPSQSVIPEPPVQNPGTPLTPGNPFQMDSPQGTNPSPFNSPEPSMPGSIAETPMQPSESTPISLNPTGIQSTSQPGNPLDDLSTGGTGFPPEMTNASPSQPASTEQNPSSSQTGTLDLSSLQANTPPAPEGSGMQPGNSLPESGPIENAPTDLSHLIAGEETNQQSGDIYNPPVASEHNPGINPSQPQTQSADGSPPHEKNLNLTKVLLVAGIPIILIVVALSAYIFLGVGKSSPQSTTNQTSLPAIQTKPEQAPLTNPPQQIVAPSSTTTPNTQTVPSSTGSESTSSGTTLPGASSSPVSALEQLKARQAVSPSPSL